MSSLPPGPAELRRDLLWIAGGAALLFLVFLGARDLWNPNEPIYGQAVAEMDAAGRWLVPTVNGTTFGEKPILYFWLARISTTLLGGVDELTLRLPSALAGIAGVVLLYLLVCRAAGALRARLAAASFATTYLVFWSARAVQMDLLVTVCTLGAVFVVIRVLDHGLAPWRGGALAGLAGGLGFLAKGPVGLICPALVVLLYAASTGRLRRLGPGLLAAAGLVCLAVAAPWPLVLWLRGETEFLTEMLYRQNVTRFLEPWDHQRPWWYFLANFWIDMAPWGFFLLLAARLPDRDEHERRLDRLAWCWILGVVGFFSLSASKRSPYILQAAPAVALLVSGLFERVVYRTIEVWRRRAVEILLAGLGGLMLAAAAYLPIAVQRDASALLAPGRAVALLLAAGGAAILSGLVMRAREPLAAPAALFAAVLSIYLLAAVWVLPAADRYKSAQPFCREVLSHVEPGQALRIYRGWKWRAGYAYYTGRRIDRLRSAEELEAYWASPTEVYLIAEGNLEEVQSVVGDVAPLVSGSVGSHRVHLLSNR